MAKRKRKPRRNAGKVISLAAFRKKKEQEEPSDEPDEPDEPEAAGRSYAEMKARGELWWQGGRPGGPTTPEEVDERMAAMRDAMQVKRNLTRLLKVTQRIFSPSTVKRNLPIVAEYDDDTLRRFAFESTEKQWLEKPSFFRAVMREAADRWGMFAPKDNPEENVTMKWTKKHKREWRAAHKESDLAFRIVGGPDTFVLLVFDYDTPDGVPFAASPEVASLREAKKLAKGAVESVTAEGNPKKKATKKKSRKKAPKRRRPSARDTRAKQAEIRRLFPDETGEIMASWVGLEQQNPSDESHRNNAIHYAEEAVAHATEAESLERSGRSHTAYHDHQESRDEAKRALDEIAHAGRGKWPGKAKIESQMRIVIRHAEAGMERTCAPKDNPNTTEHREAAQKLSRAASEALNSARTSEERGRPWEEEFNSYLNALVWAMAAHREAEYGMPKRKEGRRQRKGARRMAWSVESTERRVLQIAEDAIQALRQMVVTAADRGRGEGFLAAGDQSAASNPANIPGGNMTDCIAIMEARGDVESPGALCNWLSQKAGKPRGSGRRASRAGRRKKVSDTLRRAMRGT